VQDFFTIHGPTDFFGNQAIWGKKLTGVRYFNFKRYTDAGEKGCMRLLLVAKRISYKSDNGALRFYTNNA